MPAIRDRRVGFSPTYISGLIPLLVVLAADGLVTWTLGFPSAALGVLAIVIAVNLPIRDIRFRAVVFLAAVALAGYQFAEH